MNTRFQLAKCLVSVLVFSACSALGQSAESWYQAGSAAEGAKNYAAAITAYQKTLQYDSTYSSAWFHLGYAYLESQQFQQAATSFKKYLSLFDKPDEQGAWLMLGITYQDLEQYDNAADAFRALIRLTNERGMSYEAHYELGHSLCLGGQYSAAIDELQNAMQREEAACDSVGACADSENLRNYLGLSYYHLGRYQDALGAYKDALWLKPNDVDTHYFLGMTYVRMGDRSDALDEYKRLQAANNKNAADLYTRILKMDSGTATASSGATPAKPAAKPQQTATQTASASAGQCQDQIDEEEYSKAVDACKLAVVSSPFSAEAWSNLGMAYFGSKRYDEAAQAYQQVTRIRPKDARAQYGVGAAYVELNGVQGSLGTWLVSDGLGAPQTFAYGGRTWMITMRPARYYKPYSVTLQKFTHEKYAGTEIPKDFSSKVTLIDPERSVNRDVLIYMNHPLRYRGETFYQAGFQKDDSATILQVVHNPSFIAPYVACVIVAAGLLVQFGFHLVGFSRQRGRAIA